MHFNAKFITLDDPLTDPNYKCLVTLEKNNFVATFKVKQAVHESIEYAPIAASYTHILEACIRSSMGQTAQNCGQLFPIYPVRLQCNLPREREKRWPLKDLNTKRNQLSRPSWVSPDILIISLFKSCRLLPCLSV